MEVFRSRLEKAGMLDQAKDFHQASGAWSLQLYKQDIEMDLRTKNMAGFQLLDLQDYPGQGSAYIGILDAFMDPKRTLHRARMARVVRPSSAIAGGRPFLFHQRRWDPRLDPGSQL